MLASACKYGAGEPPIVFWDHTGGADQVVEVEGDSFSSWLWEQLNDLG
jgi:hypothetical protein